LESWPSTEPMAVTDEMGMNSPSIMLNIIA